MDRQTFDRYIEQFNAKNYDAAKEFFNDDIVIRFAGYRIAGIDGFYDFYRFFHHYVDEQIFITQFAGDDENVILDTIVRLRGIRPLTEETLAENGYDRLVTLGPDEIKEIPQFIHYRIENGRFNEIRCVIKDIISG